LARVELDTNKNSSFIENLCEELPKAKYVFRVELDINTKTSLRKKPCDELLVTKQKIQSIKQLHREQTKKSTNKDETMPWARNFCPPSGKGYLDLGSLFLGNFMFILKCLVYMPYVLLFLCSYRRVFDPRGS